MSGWFLVWILIVRLGANVYITDYELPMSSQVVCERTRIEKEISLSENPIDWGDFTAYDVKCEYRDGEDDN